jgi:hypothetical protein
MKKRGVFTRIRECGILHLSTVGILAGGALGLTGCDSNYVASPKDEQMAGLQAKLDELDAQKSRLMNGELANNFELPGVGFYHAEARDFFPYRHGFEKDGKWYVNGVWQDTPVAEARVASSRPTPEALKKVELALAREQELLAKSNATTGSSSTTHQHHSGFGNALMMYWLLSGSRGFFSPGAGFQQATAQSGRWQQGVDQARQTVAGHAAANPGYSRMVAQSKASGVPVRAGQSVRGGFGSGSSRVSSGS